MKSDRDEVVNIIKQWHTKGWGVGRKGCSTIKKGSMLGSKWKEELT